MEIWGKQWVQLWGHFDFSLGCAEITTQERLEAGGILLSFQDVSLECKRQVESARDLSVPGIELKLWLMRSYKEKVRRERETRTWSMCINGLFLTLKKLKIKTPKLVAQNHLSLLLFTDFVGWLGTSRAGLTCGCTQVVNQLGTRPRWALVGGTWVPIHMTYAWQSRGSVPRAVSTSSCRTIIPVFSWPKQGTGQHRFKGRTSRLHLLMTEVTESHHTKF